MKTILKQCLKWMVLILPLFAFATDYNISSVDEFNDLNLSAGDNVIWQDGTYSSDERITFSGTGTANNPITLRAETPGGVIFTGGLQMDIAGSYLVVDGFYWNGGYGASNFIQFRNGTTYAQNCTIQNCAINGLQAEPGDAAEALAEGAIIKHRWVVLYGNYNSVLNCTFMNKNTAGALVLAEYEYNASPDESANTRCDEVGHTISNNYFYNYEKQDASLSNAGDSETIRIGTSEFQNVNSQALVSGNYFVQADGENEIITNKSMNNTYINNTFRRSRGSLVMRHGSDATVTGNYFLGENVEGTGGIRIADSNHQITNNYIQDCISSVEQIAWNNGLTFVGGNTNSVQDCNSTSVSNSYQDVENINFSNNTFINTHSPFYFNATRDGADDVFGDVTNNLIYFESNNDNTTDVINGSYTEVGSTLTFSGNVYDGAPSLGGTASGFTSESITVSANGEIFTHNQSGKGASISAAPITDSMVGNGVGACFLGAEGNSQTNCDGTITPTPVTDSLTISSISDFDADESSQTITVTSNVDWVVTENSAWISVNTNSGSDNGSITITANENTSTTSRTATITVSGSEITRTVSITQDGAEEETTTPTEDYTEIPALIQAENYFIQEGLLTEDSQDIDNGTSIGWVDQGDNLTYNINVPATGIYSIDFRVASRTAGTNLDIYQGDDLIGSISDSTANGWYNWYTTSVEVELNQGEQTLTLLATAAGWNINWFEINSSEIIENNNCTEGTNLSLNGTIVDFSAEQNTTNTVQNIIDDSTSNRWSAETFPQYATIDLGDEYNVNEVNLSTFENRDYQFIVDGSTTSSTSGFSTLVDASDNTNDGTITETFSAQTVRYVRLTITGANSYSGEWISISQFQIICAGGNTPTNTESLTVSSINDFDSNTNSQTVTISSNVDWTVSENSSWISINNTSGSDDGSFSITTSENTSTEERSATVTVTGDNISRLITVSQEGQEVIVTPTDSCTSGTNLVLNGTIVDFSAQENTTNTVTNILNENGRWSAETFPQFATIDLGGDYSVDQISLATYQDRDYQFIVDGSTSSATSGFSTLVDASDNTSDGPITETFSAQTVRYVRLTITGANSYSGEWASINQFQVNCAGGDIESEEEEEEVVIPTDLDPRLAPSENFDLTNWNINVPIEDPEDGDSTNIQRTELNDGYELKDVDGRDYFYTGADGGMVFRNYPKDAPKTSPNTSYTRTELREILTDNTSASASENNWYFSTSGNDIPNDAGGIDGVLTATLAVNHVTVNGNSNHRGRVVIGQIHGRNNEPNRLYYHKLPEHDKGAIYVAHETFDGDENYYNLIGNYIENGSDSNSLNDDIEEPADGIEFDEQFSYRIEVEGNDQLVTISRPGKADIVLPIDMSDSGYDEGDYMYFKAGAYSQNNTTTLDDDYDQVTFYALAQSHDNNSAKSLLETLNEQVMVYPNPFINTINIDFLDNTIVSVAKVRVIDASSRVVLTADRDAQESSIELQGNFSTGVYFIQLLDSSENVIAMKKVISE